MSLAGFWGYTFYFSIASNACLCLSKQLLDLEDRCVRDWDTVVCLDLIITGLCGAQAVSHHMWAGWRLLMLLALISGENKIA